MTRNNRSSSQQQQQQQHQQSHSLSSLSSSSFTSSIMESPHSMAQKLNNQASYLITIGKYQQGINLLTKALKLADQQSNCTSSQDGIHYQAAEVSFQAILPSCNCEFCSLESCFFMDYDSLMSYVNDDGHHNHNHELQEEEEEEEKENKGYYSHRQQQQDEHTPSQDSGSSSSSSSTYSNKHKTDDTHTHHHDGGFVYQQPLLYLELYLFILSFER